MKRLLFTFAILAVASTAIAGDLAEAVQRIEALEQRTDQIEHRVSNLEAGVTTNHEILGVLKRIEAALTTPPAAEASSPDTTCPACPAPATVAASSSYPSRSASGHQWFKVVNGRVNTAMSRESLIEHLANEGVHAGKFSRAYLAGLSRAQLIALHSDDHEGAVRWQYVAGGKPATQPVKIVAPSIIYQPAGNCPNGQCPLRRR